MTTAIKLLSNCIVLLSVFAFSISADSTTTEGAQVYTLDDIIRAVAIDVHPSKPIIAIAGRFETGFGFYFYNVENGQIDYILTSGSPNSVFWSPDGNYIASSVTTAMTGQYQVYNAENGQMLSSVDHGGLESFDIAWSPDSTQYAVPTGFSQRGVSIISVSTGSIATEYVIDTNALGNTFSLSWHNNNLAILHGSRQVSVWDTNSGTQIDLYPIAERSSSIRISPDGTKLAVSGNFGSTEILSLPTGDTTAMLTPPGVVFSRSIAWSSDSQSIASFVRTNTDTIYTWDIASGVLQGEINLPEFVPPGDVAWYDDRIVYISSAGDKLIFADTTSSATTSP